MSDCVGGKGAGWPLPGVQDDSDREDPRGITWPLGRAFGTDGSLRPHPAWSCS